MSIVIYFREHQSELNQKKLLTEDDILSEIVEVS